MFFQKGKNIDALKHYNRCFDCYLNLKSQHRGLLSAPGESPVLPVLFANRSAVLFKMTRFADCVADIDEALRLGYPENLKYKVE